MKTADFNLFQKAEEVQCHSDIRVTSTSLLLERGHYLSSTFSSLTPFPVQTNCQHNTVMTHCQDMY